MNRQLVNCPVCGSKLTVTRLHCRNCDTTLEGHFHPETSPFGVLSKEQQEFVLAFIRCEGRFTRLEDELKMSYPTLRNRLNAVIRTLGFEPGREEEPARPSAEERARILSDLAEGKLTAEIAQQMLRGEKVE